MKPLGLILAAGKSIRMPNKVLLPIDNDMIAYDSAVDLLRRSECDIVRIVADDVVGKALQVLRPQHESIYQTEPGAGVINAVKSAERYAISGGYTHIVVTFADNIYSVRDRVERSSVPYATVRTLPRNTRLDGWDQSLQLWRPRSVQLSTHFAGYMFVPIEMVVSADSHEAVLDFLNANGITPSLRKTPWWDIGTLDSYEAYLEEISRE